MITITRKSSILFAAIALLTVGASQAQAQESPASGSTALEGATAKQKISFSREIVSEMQDGIKDARRMLDAANKDGDPEKIQCVKDKLASMEALKQVTEAAEGRLTEALAANYVERADHELRKIGVAASKFRQFYAEEAACIGEASIDENTQVEVQELADENETDEQYAEIVIDPDPPNMTPFE